MSVYRTIGPLVLYQTAVKREQDAINKLLKQKSKLEKVKNKSPSDEHSIVSFHNLLLRVII